MNYIFAVLTSFSFICVVHASFGDQSPYYQKCIEKCSLLNCTEDGLSFLHDVITFQSTHLRLLRWNCEDECKYDCMWKTVEAFQNRKWRVPQFYGKWPFIRIFGLQEPASVIFSLLNIYIHYTMFKRFKNHIQKNSPVYWLWHIFFGVCLNAWFWSSIFHARDLPFTEFMDYACAFSMVLVSFYCMAIRLLYDVSPFLKTVVTSFHLAFFLNHAFYLGNGKFDYGYNMKVNIAIGSLNGIIWFAWCIWNRKRQPYLWKCIAFVSLAGLAMGLEILDFPPLFWILDCHSLWHLSTALITPFFYSFIIDDCTYLNEQKMREKYNHLE